jgi:hypothetical protein
VTGGLYKVSQSHHGDLAVELMSLILEKAGGSEVPTKVRRAGLTVKRMKGAPTLLLSW